MGQYKVIASGTDMGTYEGDTELEAIAAMQRDAGYKVNVEAGKLVYGSPEHELLCTGDVRAELVV